MRFWDTSAVVPLLLTQPGSALADSWVLADAGIVLWTLTSVEITSALSRLDRDGALGREQVEAAEAAAEELGHAAHTIIDVEAVKARARRALRLHPLRAADALQLGAALEWANGRPDGHILHTFAVRLATAARLEGFRVVGE